MRVQGQADGGLPVGASRPSQVGLLAVAQLLRPVPLRLCGVVAPVSVLFAVANAPLVYAGRRVAQFRWGGAPPALLCLGLVLRLGTPRPRDIAIEAGSSKLSVPMSLSSSD